MTQPTDPVLLESIKQFLTGLPKADRDAFVAEVSAAGAPDTGGLDRGRQKYAKANGGGNWGTEGPERIDFTINR